MSDNVKTLFSKRVPGGKSRNYFIDVRESERGNKYLVVSESRIFQGSWTSHRLMLFPEKVGEWRQILDEAIEVLKDGAAAISQ